jgi:hypothetical protein
VKIQFYIILGFCMALLACNNTTTSKDQQTKTVTETKPVDNFHWPNGKYLYVSKEGMFFEEWAKTDSVTFKGTNFFIGKTKNDTLFSMTIKLIRGPEKTTMYYKLKGLNNKDSEFTLTKEDENLYVFENPFHDYTSIIEYKILGDTAFEVIERGFVKNKEREEKYIMKKID